MGCFPFGRGNNEETKGHGKRGSKRWKKSKSQRYQMEGEMYGHPTTRSVIYYNDGPIVMAHPEAVQYHNQEVGLVPDLGYASVVAKGSDEAPPPPSRARVRFALPEGQHEAVHTAVVCEGKTVGPSEAPNHHHQGHEVGVVPTHAYNVPSPLVIPSEYSYPIPVREGVYRLGTDANRFTTLFSEENPNACSIA